MNPTKISALSLGSFVELTKVGEVNAIFKSKLSNGVITVAALVNFKPNIIEVSYVEDGYSRDPVFGGVDEHGRRGTWNLNSQQELVRGVQGKQQLVDVLISLGMKKPQLDVLRNVSASELSEFVDRSGVDRDSDKEVQVTLKSKAFKAGFEIVHPLAKTAVVRADKAYGSMNYTIFVPFADQLAKIEAEVDEAIESTKLPIFAAAIR